MKSQPRLTVATRFVFTRLLGTNELRLGMHHSLGGFVNVLFQSSLTDTLG
jgi:hypothetical protein